MDLKLKTFFAIIVMVIVVVVPSPSLAALPGQGIIDKAGEFTEGIEKKLDSAEAVKTIEKNLPSQEETKGFLRSVGNLLFILIRFVANVFDWALEVLTSAVYLIADRIGLGFFRN